MSDYYVLYEGVQYEVADAAAGVAKAKDRAAMVDEMISAVRRAWNERKNK